jgi:hypothetical protein
MSCIQKVEYIKLMNSYRKSNTNFIIRRESIEPIPTVINNEILNL